MSGGLKPEERLHLAVAAYLAVALRMPVWWSTIGHGSRVSPREGAMLRRKGLKPGVPDILVIAPQPYPSGPVVIGIELKAGAGRRSADQIATHADMTMAGAHVVVCRSVADVEAVLARYGVPLHAQVMAGRGAMKVAA